MFPLEIQSDRFHLAVLSNNGGWEKQAIF